MFVLWVIVDWVLITLCLKPAAKIITSVDLGWRRAAIIALVASLLALIPYAGWGLSIFAIYSLAKHFTQADPWPELVLLVVTSWLLPFVVSFLLWRLVAGG